jgi:hypothetical protein
MIRRSLNLGIASIIVAAAIVLWLTADSGFAGDAPPPGVSAGVSAFDRSPRAGATTPELQSDIALLASTIKTDVGRAMRDLHVFRTGLGVERLNVYAFRNDLGSPCVVVGDFTGFCAKRPTDGTPGLHWAIGGGTKTSPSRLVGVASDDVTSIELVVDRQNIPVSLENNVVFGEFPADATNASVTIRRADGAQNSFDVALKG